MFWIEVGVGRLSGEKIVMLWVEWGLCLNNGCFLFWEVVLLVMMKFLFFVIRGIDFVLFLFVDILVLRINESKNGKVSNLLMVGMVNFVELMDIKMWFLYSRVVLIFFGGECFGIDG